MSDSNVTRQHRITVSYEGPGPDRGWMNATDVGTAIVGMGEMVSGASKVLYGDDARIEANVRADFEHASFEMIFEIVAAAHDIFHMIDNVNGVLSTLGLNENANGVIQFLQWARGRKIVAEELVEGGMKLRIARGKDGDSSITLTLDTYRALKSRQVRDGLKAFVQPLWREGVERVLASSTDTQAPSVEIERYERDAFIAPVLPSDTVDISRATMIVTIVSPVFEGNYVWRVSHGDAKYTARMGDDDFLESIRRDRIEFGRGHALRVTMETEIIDKGDGSLSYRHRIIKVHDHIRPKTYEQEELGPEDTHG